MAQADIREIARITYETVTAQKYALSNFTMQDSPRMRVVLSLFVACMDHAASAALMLRTQPDTCGISAMTLLRPQVEAFSRAIMFSVESEVTDDEIRAFIEKDKLPQRIPLNSKSKDKKDVQAKAVQEIAMREVNAMVRGIDDGSEITRFVHFAEKELHSFVHGGRMVVRMYDEGPQSIGFSLAHDTAREILYHMGLLSMMALTFAEERLADNPEPSTGLLAVTWRAFVDHLAYKPVDLPERSERDGGS